MNIARLFPLCVLCTAMAPAATLPVTTTADAGAGSLRAQIAAAASGDTVSIGVTGTITLTTGEIVATGKNLVIAGPGAPQLTLTTGGSTRALRIVNGSCTITGLTFSNCKGLPGDVDTGGALAVDNFTAGGDSNVTTIRDCAFTGNQSGWGGAVDIFHGGLVMSGCTFANNTCTGVAFGTNGGGGAMSLGPTLASTITNCTFSANSQAGATAGQPGGGAIYNYGAGPVNPPAVTVEHCTFVANVDAAGAGGAIQENNTTSYHTWANLKNCLLLNNQAPVAVLQNFSAGVSGSLPSSYSSLGGNVTDEGTSSAQFMAAGDKVGAATLAATVVPSLTLNGGATMTHALRRGSPAQRSALASTAATDQRGAPRHAVADAGAFELIEPELQVSVAAAPIAEQGSLAFGPTPFGSPLVKSVTITNTQTSSFSTGPLVLASPSAPAGYAVSGFPTAPLGNGQSASFTVTLPAVDPGQYRSALTFTGNDRYDSALALATSGVPNQHTLRLDGLVTDTLDHWRQHWFGAGATNAGSAADLASPAGDGLSNLLKYSLGLNPQLSYPAGAGTLTGLDGSGHLTLTVARNPAAADVLMAAEVCGDLRAPGGWSGTGVTVDQDTESVFQAHDNTPIAGAPARFIRLKVTRP